MKKPIMNASSLKIIMRFVVVVIIGLSIAGFYSAQQSLNSFAKEVKVTVSKSINTTSSSSSTNTLKNQIAEYKTSSDTASNITFSAQNYKETITQYINKFASLNNISVTNLSFSNTSGTPIATSSSINSLTTDSAILTLASPINFTDLMQFIKSIEVSSPKMQITKISLTRNSDGTIKVDPINIEFYVR